MPPRGYAPVATGDPNDNFLGAGDDLELTAYDHDEESGRVPVWARSPTDSHSFARAIPPPARKRCWRPSTVGWVTIAVSSITSLSLLMTFPFPTTVHVFVGLAVGLACWTTIAWAQQVLAVSATLLAAAKHPRQPTVALTIFLRWVLQLRWMTVHFGTLLICTGIVFSGLCIGLIPPPEDVPYIPRRGSGGTKYFVAANLFNNEDLVPHWSNELVSLVKYLGPEHTFVSVYESNSDDSTALLLHDLREELSGLGAMHRIISENRTRWWPYSTSPERIQFLSDARNKALEPLQSEDASLRLPDYNEYTTVVFLNDVIFSWQSVVRLIATRLDDGESGKYDLACGMDFFQSGLYDTWAARDVCGTPMRITWPYVKDRVSAQLLRRGKPFPVSSCWNGMVAFPAENYLYRPQNKTVDKAERGSLAKRGWKMVDNATYPHTVSSPPLTTPIKFRWSGIEACDHSECFLFSYDIHRLYNTPERPARIVMNPEVRTAYTWRWYAWENYVVRIPIVDWWRYYWSHGWPNALVDWMWEIPERRQDYCTWAALTNTAPPRCRALPGAKNRGWNG